MLFPLLACAPPEEVNKMQVHNFYECEPIVFAEKVTDTVVNLFSNSYLQECGQRNEAEVHINSWGGSTTGAYAAYDAKFASGIQDLTTVGFGKVGSAAVILFLAGDERHIGCNAAIYLHMGEISAGYKTYEELIAWAEYRRVLDDQFAQIVSDRTGIALAKVWDMMSKDTFIYADEAVALGFAHKKVGCT